MIPCLILDSPLEQLAHLFVDGGLCRDAGVRGLEMDHCLAVLIDLQVQVFLLLQGERGQRGNTDACYQGLGLEYITAILISFRRCPSIYPGYSEDTATFKIAWLYCLTIETYA